MPIIRRFSGANRAPMIFEITDINDSRATEYLIENGIPDKLSMMLINYFGGRLVYMVGSISLYNAYTKLGMTSALELYNNIIRDLFARKIQDEGFVIEEKYPKSHELLHVVSRYHIISPPTLLGKQSGDDRQLMTNDIAHLVERNVLRYTTDGMLTWHGKVEEHHFKMQANIFKQLIACYI